MASARRTQSETIQRRGIQTPTPLSFTAAELIEKDDAPILVKEDSDSEVEASDTETTPQKSEIWDPNPRVIGRELNDSEQSLSNQVNQTAKALQDPAIPMELKKRLIFTITRATYGITDPFICEAYENISFTNKVETKLIITEYLGFVTIAVFKPADEVRGGKNYKAQKDAGKLGVAPESEMPNELIGAMFGLKQPVVEMTIPGPFVYLDSTPFPKRGVAISFLEEMVEYSKVPNMDQALENTSMRAFQKMAIMDIALCNTDRNPGNLMVNPTTGEIGLIDQAMILPKGFGSPAVYIWMLDAKAQQPFDADSLAQIENLDFARDAAKILKSYPDYPQGSIQTMRITYNLLKKGAAAGLTPFQIGSFLTGAIEKGYTPMQTMFENAKEFAGDNSELIYSIINMCLDEVIEKLEKNPLIITPDMSTVEIKEKMENKLNEFVKEFFKQ